MPLPEPPDPLDLRLQEENPHLDDAGFTARVMSVLPRRRRAWWRPAILLGTVAMGSMFAARWLPWRELAALDGQALLSLNPQSLLPWAVVFSIMGSLTWTTLDAFQSED